MAQYTIKGLRDEQQMKLHRIKWAETVEKVNYKRQQKKTQLCSPSSARSMRQYMRSISVQAIRLIDVDTEYLLCDTIINTNCC